jgi:hypothetical protein
MRYATKIELWPLTVRSAVASVWGPKQSLALRTRCDTDDAISRVRGVSLWRFLFPKKEIQGPKADRGFVYSSTIEIWMH